MSNRSVLVGGACAGFIVVVFLFSLWQPEKQIRRHQRQLESAIEDADWAEFRELLSDRYSDRWGHDKEFVISRAREVFRPFTMSIKGEIQSLAVEEGRGEVRTRLQIDPKIGDPRFSFGVIRRANSLAEPWVFRWEKQSWKPWDWQLLYVDQPEIEIPSA